MTAQDVVFTVEALKDPAASGAMAGAWADVTATAVDPKTVELTVATPIAGFLAATTQPLLPSHLLSDVPLADLAKSPFAKAPVGTGPYALSELDDTHALLTPVALMPRPNGRSPPGRGIRATGVRSACVVELAERMRPGADRRLRRSGSRGRRPEWPIRWMRTGVPASSWPRSGPTPTRPTTLARSFIRRTVVMRMIPRRRVEVSKEARRAAFSGRPGTHRRGDD